MTDQYTDSRSQSGQSGKHWNVEDLVCSATELPSPKDITIERVDLSRYDALLTDGSISTDSGDGALTAVPTVEANA